MAIHEIVNDDAMYPRFIKGEYVAGIQRFGKEIISLINHDCIIKTVSGETFIRHLQQTNNQDHYQLNVLNADFQPNKITIPRLNIISAAAIIWARRDN